MSGKYSVIFTSLADICMKRRCDQYEYFQPYCNACLEAPAATTKLIVFLAYTAPRFTVFYKQGNCEGRLHLLLSYPE